MKILTHQRMTDISEYLIYLPKEELIICRACKYALTPNGLELHLQRKHKTIPLPTRKILNTYSMGLDRRGPLTVIQPKRIIAGYDCLELIKGFQCSTCREFSKTIISMEVHCNRKHGWVKSNGNTHATVTNST